MKLYLDDREIAADRPTLGGAIAAGVREAESRGRIIVEAWVDGQAVVGEELGTGAEEDRSGAEIRLTSAEPKALVLTTFLDVAEGLGPAREAQQAAAEAIEAGSVQEGLGLMGEALGVWDQARQALGTGCALMGIGLDVSVAAGTGGDAGGERSRGVTPQGAADVLATHLAELKRCIEAQDWTGLADVLRYDLEGEAERWQAMLRGLADMVRGTRGGSA